MKINRHGHRNLEQLQRYLEVSDEQVLGAVSALSMLSPVGQVVKRSFNDLSTPESIRVQTKHD
ncbi:hypothetical protein [Dolichospermum compactum]|uniref:Phage integrase family protein n=1 Tax=Dolichospermum compactum NIES-806 TaxID=1973481 RepID=A0A1Z4V5A3_9CYAN|nr:hypothetical protein [Dolichospermum compactum]BAZ86726.1 phage integrase family protein [Dolichospermum compactum NIES-806]